jgi:4-hydroxy-tetrahydrodipicolinate synthase
MPKITSNEVSLTPLSLPSGVMAVLPTPFDEDARLDRDSLANLANHAIGQGSTALVCFGLASEGYKLTDGERTATLATVVDASGGRVPVIAGSDNNSVESAAYRTEEYFLAGASAVMTMPPSFVKPEPHEILEYYRRVGVAAAGLPVIIQDAPSWTGVSLPVDLLRNVRDLAPNVAAVKVENPPNHQKITELRALGFLCVGGYGALHLMEDIDAGISSVMYGAGSIAEMVELWEAVERDVELGWRKFEQLLPLLSFQMSSLDVFIATQKELLKQKGVIASSNHRPPGRSLSPHQIAWLNSLIQRFEGSR